MKKIIAILLALMMLCSLAACGSSSKAATESSSTAYRNSAYDGGMAYDMVAEGEYGGFAAEEPAAASAAGASEEDVPDGNPDKIIYSADATVETTDFEDACAALLEFVDKYDGWVESSSVNGANYRTKASGSTYNRSAYYVIRIPSKSFSTVMNELSALGNVPYSHTYTENVSAQYYDLEARLTAYQTQETRLLEMMEVAETVSDVITIEDRLTELRYQIESIQTTLNSWDRQVSYSTINLSVDEVQEYTPEAAENYWQELWQSLVDGLKNALNFIKDFLVFIVGALPVLLVLAGIGYVLFLAIRKLHRAKKARKEKKALAKAAAAASKAAPEEPKDTPESK